MFFLHLLSSSSRKPLTSCEFVHKLFTGLTFPPSKLYNICISNRSKLWVERTKKSLARNSRVLSSKRYTTDTQRVITLETKISKSQIQKKRPFHRKRTTFTFHQLPFCYTIRASLLFKCSTFGEQRSPEWSVGWCRTLRKAIKSASEISRIDFCFVTLFYRLSYICTHFRLPKLSQPFTSSARISCSNRSLAS